MPSSEPASPAGSLRIWIFVVCLVAAFGFLATDSWQRLREIRLATATTVNGATLPRPDPSSPTGYAHGCRNLIFPLGFSDGMEWIILTQEMLAKGEWRLRSTGGDNWPAGREVHWSSSLMWWLIACGKVARLWSGESLAAAVESVAPWANTLFLFLLLALLPLHAGRRFGWTAGGVLALGLVTLYPLYEFFSVGYPDHHGLVTMGCLLGAYALASGGGGWVATAEEGNAPSLRSARRSFVAAGLAGAFAMWISAATAVPVIGALGLGGLVVSRLARTKAPEGMRYEPRLWRWWSRAGAAGSLAFYLLEYFPGHLGMRLEVNHPLHALAWLGGGEIVCRLGAWLAGGRLVERRRDRALLAVAGFAVVLPPALALLFPERFFLVSDPFVWALHRDYIAEFAPIWRRMREMSWSDSLAVYGGAVPVALVGTVVTLLFRRLDVTWRTRLLLAVAPALVVTLLGCRQSRWLGVACGLWDAAIPVWFGALAATPRSGAWRRVVPGLLVIGMLPFPYQAATQWWHLFQPAQMARPTAAMLYVRDVAQKLREDGGSTPPVVASSPTTTTWLMYYGGARGLGSLYWENAAGLKTSAAIYGARTDEEALSQIRRHGVTHLVMFSKNLFATPYTRLAQGLTPDRQPEERFVLRALRTGELPPWARPSMYPVPPGLEILGDWVQVWEVQPESTRSNSQGVSSP